jgi:hypothetical protein
VAWYLVKPREKFSFTLQRVTTSFMHAVLILLYVWSEEHLYSNSDTVLDLPYATSTMLL